MGKSLTLAEVFKVIKDTKPFKPNAISTTQVLFVLVTKDLL